MPYIPLVEHTRPRILMLDFSPQDVEKVVKAGFDVRRLASGLRDTDRSQFHFPVAVQDAEIIFVAVEKDTFNFEGRSASNDSIEKEPYFKDLMRETWEKCGWIVFFLSQNISPEELGAVGIKKLGVMAFNRAHYPESIREPWTMIGQNEVVSNLPKPQIPKFLGHSINTADDPILEVVIRYIKSAEMSILTCDNVPQFIFGAAYYAPQPHLDAFYEHTSIKELIWDDSADKNIMGIKLEKARSFNQDDKYITNHGGILLLPDFNRNNVNVAIGLLQEVFSSISPHLFDTPQHSWLENYQPVPVAKLLDHQNDVIQKARDEVARTEKHIETERENFGWLTGLLVSLGDQFAAEAAGALRFLGFEVEEVDNSLAPNERRREDFRICDEASGYFVLGEAKTTGKGRGASEDFITKTQAHQNRYARENNQAPPPALLIVNFAVDLEPNIRLGRFYQTEVVGNLEDSRITALNSVALFDICQIVLRDQISKEQARRFISSGRPLIGSVSLEELTNQDS